MDRFMSSTAAIDAHATFSDLLRGWRKTVGISQLELAGRCGSSQRHISFLESGRSSPSRPMIVSLSEALGVPLDRRNELMLAAGFAPTYHRRDLDDPALQPVRQAIAHIISANEPYPAVVFDWRHDVIDMNAPALRLMLLLFDVVPPDGLPAIAGNTLQGMFFPGGYADKIVNWEQTASTMLRRLRAEVVAAGKPPEGVALLDELAACPCAPRNWRQCTDVDLNQPLMAIELALRDHAIRLFSTLTTLGAPIDATLQHIRIESFFPADEAAREFFGNPPTPS